MKKEKKAIALLSVVFGTLLISPINVKATECTGSYSFYFSEATSRTDPRSVNSSYETCFTLPGAVLKSMSGANASQMTESDCEKYMGALTSRDNAGKTDNDAYCDEYGNCVNSGTENVGTDSVRYVGSCSSYINDFSINNTAKISSDVSSAVANECSAKGGIGIKIERDYNFTNSDAENKFVDANGNGWNFINNVIDVTFTYEVEGECPGSPEPSKNHTECVSSSGSETINMGCNGGASASGEYSKNLNGKRAVSIKHDQQAKRICGDDARIESTSSGNFLQNGQGQSSFGSLTYAGGGAKVSFKFTTTANWEWCGPASIEQKAICKRYEIEVCPSGYDYVGGQCRACAEEKCHKNDEGYETCSCVRYDYTSPCSSYNSYSCDEEDQEVANQIAYQNAGKESKSISTNGQATARDSNEESDSTEYRIEKGGADTKHEAGKFNGGGGGGGSWTVGTSRSGTVSFGIYNTCINVYNPFTVRYVESGQCNEDEIKGGTLYYIPLKAGTSSDRTKVYPFKANVDDVSILNGLTWPLNVSCNLNYNQKMFGNDRKLDYRPIDMSIPFPKAQGQIGNCPSNWQLFMSKNELVQKYMDRDIEEYIGSLSLGDIEKIKQLSNSSVYRYADLRSISLQGKSSLLDSFGIDIKNNNNYNELGKCEKDCW